MILRSSRWKRIQFWVPQLDGPGGIQAYSRQLIQATARILPETSIRVLVKNGLSEFASQHSSLTVRSLARPNAPLRNARYAALLLEEVLRGKPELIILTHLHLAPLAHALKQLFHFEYWVAVHGMESWELSCSQRRALAGAERILPVSRWTASRLSRQMELDPTRLSLLPNSVDEEIFRPAKKPSHLLKRYGLSPEHRIIFTLSRLEAGERYKGCDRMLEAMVLVQQQVPQAHYLLAGRGSDTGRLWREIQHRGLEETVTLTGYLPQRELCDHYNLGDVFALPSCGEGFGIVYLEALACGRPVVAGNQDGAREPLLHGRLGALVNPHDPVEMADALIKILCGSHPQNLLFHPARLRDLMLEIFGETAFNSRLGELLAS